MSTSASIAATRSASRRLVHDTNTASSEVRRTIAAIPSAIESTAIRAASRSSRLSNVANAATSAPCALRYARTTAFTSGAYGVITPMRRAPNALNAAKAAVIGVVHATPGRARRIWRNTSSSPSAMLAEVQPNATTSSRASRQDQFRRRRDQRTHRAQRLRRDVGVVVEPRAINRDAGQADQVTELVLHRLICCQHQQADRGARGNAAIQRAWQHAEIGEAGDRVHPCLLKSPGRARPPIRPLSVGTSSEYCALRTGRSAGRGSAGWPGRAAPSHNPGRARPAWLDPVRQRPC